MAVAFDAVVTQTLLGVTTPNPLTWTHTPVGTPTAFVLAIINWDAGATYTTVSYGGTTMTSPIVAAIDGSHSVYIYSLANPPSGAQTVSVGYSGTEWASFASMTFTGSDTSTVFRATNTATGTGTAASVSVTSNTGDLVVDAVGNVNSATFTAGGSQTVQANNIVSGNNVLSDSTQPGGASSTTMSWTLSTSQQWAQAAGSVKVASSVVIPTFNRWSEGSFNTDIVSYG